MSERLDKALAALDAGLQTSAEHGYGTDLCAGWCARCQLHDPVKDGDLCEGCRAFLLGDTDVDPSTRRSLAVRELRGAAYWWPGRRPRTPAPTYTVTVAVGDELVVEYHASDEPPATLTVPDVAVLYAALCDSMRVVMDPLQARPSRRV